MGSHYCFNTPGINIPEGCFIVFIDYWSLTCLFLFSTGRPRHKISYSATEVVQMGFQCPEWHLSAERCLCSLLRSKKRCLKALHNLLLSDPFMSLKNKESQQIFTSLRGVIRFWAKITIGSRYSMLRAKVYTVWFSVTNPKSYWITALCQCWIKMTFAWRSLIQNESHLENLHLG